MMSKNLRPKRLREALDMSLGDDPAGTIDELLREFLDEFYLCDDDSVKSQMIQEEPRITGHEKKDAYLGAVAEHLAFKYNLPVPDWCAGEKRFLHRAWFPCGLESLKATLIKESPVSFRRRMIFVDANPLFRPRQLKNGVG